MKTFVQHQDLHHKIRNKFDSPCLTKKGIKDLKDKETFKTFKAKQIKDKYVHMGHKTTKEIKSAKAPYDF